MKKCPYCAEEIQDEAIKCRYCGSLLLSELKEYYRCNMCDEIVKPKSGKCPICSSTREGKEEDFTKADIDELERINRKKCSDCDTSFENKDAFCTSCGKFTGRKCPKCKTKRKTNTEYCENCGLDFRHTTNVNISEITKAKKNEIQLNPMLGQNPNVVVKHRANGCLGCLIWLIILIILFPIIAFVFKVAVLITLIQSILSMLGLQ